MTSNLEKVITKTAKIMLISLILLVSACNPYKYAYKSTKAERKALETLKKGERSLVND